MVVTLVSFKNFLGPTNHRISKPLLWVCHTPLILSSWAPPQATKLSPSILDVQSKFTNGKTISKDLYSRGLGLIRGYTVGPKVQMLIIEKGLFIMLTLSQAMLKRKLWPWSGFNGSTHYERFSILRLK